MDVEMQIDPYEMTLFHARKHARIQKIQLIMWIVALFFWVILSMEFISLKHRLARVEDQLHHLTPVPTRGTIDSKTL